MSLGRSWREVKAEAHRLHPELTDPQRQAAADAHLDAYVADHHLKELRKSVGKTQSEVAAALGISQARVSQIENGDLDSMELETIRAYAAALGGHVDVTISVGPHSVRVA
ncbi:Transcriptional regulator, XRE family [[Actinomadura] parvosata subsp. kistnae]|uniref:Transcriptional regulator n=1 Tax=[Actinomadura] parvosata subsp. kistnae TaxID=1909395 RepID=A0A1V0A8V6_9ACTN|nr:helix-turn-helix transcriptional regulator [Nonomuraea sp. ATCC 55076]AQZ66647.1 transcriptional regulator [Nonomuraea sp. ATCC 55076]SPL95252.1 Transcriptional regulator, XRE family [Actinomadura parvosata subsp. kistnae]